MEEALYDTYKEEKNFSLHAQSREVHMNLEEGEDVPEDWLF